MSSNDYFMKQITGMTDMVAHFLFGEKPQEDELVYETQLSTEAHSLLIDLRFMVAQRLLCEAENLLFENIERSRDPAYIEVAAQFYGWLDELSDDELRLYNFSRVEIGEGRRDVAKAYGVAPIEAT